MNGLEGGEADGRRRRKQAARPTTGEQAHRKNTADREVDGQTEAQVEDHVSRRRKQAARPTRGEQAHRQKHGRTERWTDKRKRK